MIAPNLDLDRAARANRECYERNRLSIADLPGRFILIGHGKLLGHFPSYEAAAELATAQGLDGLPCLIFPAEDEPLHETIQATFAEYA